MDKELCAALNRVKILRVFDTEGLLDAVQEFRKDCGLGRTDTSKNAEFKLSSLETPTRNDPASPFQHSAQGGLRLVIVDDLVQLFVGSNTKGGSSLDPVVSQIRN